MNNIKFIKFGSINNALKNAGKIASAKSFFSFRYEPRDARLGYPITKDNHAYFNSLLRQAFPASIPAFSTYSSGGFLQGYGFIEGTGETLLSSESAKNLIKDLLNIAIPNASSNGLFTWVYKTQAQINSGQTTQIKNVLSPAQQTVRNTNNNVNNTVNQIPDFIADIPTVTGISFAAMLALGGLGLVLYIQLSR